MDFSNSLQTTLCRKLVTWIYGWYQVIKKLGKMEMTLKWTEKKLLTWDVGIGWVLKMVLFNLMRRFATDSNHHWFPLFSLLLELIFLRRRPDSNNTDYISEKYVTNKLYNFTKDLNVSSIYFCLKFLFWFSPIASNFSFSCSLTSFMLRFI